MSFIVKKSGPSSGLGYGQSWVQYTPNVDRAANSAYTNSTSKPIMVNTGGLVSGTPVVGNKVGFIVDGVNMGYINDMPYPSEWFTGCIVPIGAVYSLYWDGGFGGQLYFWNELR